MDEQNKKYNPKYYRDDEPWNTNSWQTGSTEPPRNNNGVTALMLILIIFLCGILTVLGVMNVKLFNQLQVAEEASTSIRFLPEETLPDILSVDNFESYDSNPEHTAFFTAIDRCSKDCFIQGAELLFNELRSPSHHRVILQIPTRLVIRKSIKNINQSTRSN